MTSFDLAIEFVLGGEGGFNDDPDDRGGMTKYGISFNFLKDIPMERMKTYGMAYVDDEHLKQLIKDMDIPTAKIIYKVEFWDGTAFEKLNNQKLANTFLDCAVMSGMAAATKFVQRAVCAYIGEYGALVDDGVCGSKTIEKANLYGGLLIPSIRSERANFYRNIAKNDLSQAKNLKGWLRRAYK